MYKTTREKFLLGCEQRPQGLRNMEAQTYFWIPTFVLRGAARFWHTVHKRNPISSEEGWSPCWVWALPCTCRLRFPFGGGPSKVFTLQRACRPHHTACGPRTKFFTNTGLTRCNSDALLTSCGGVTGKYSTSCQQGGTGSDLWPLPAQTSR